MPLPTFTITNGFSFTVGGGMLIGSSSPAVINCTFSGRLRSTALLSGLFRMGLFFQEQPERVVVNQAQGGQQVDL